MRENRVRAWVEVVGSVKEKIISEFNEIPPCMKRAESKNQLSEDEFNEIRTAHSEGSSGQTNHEAKSRWCRQFPW